MKSLNRWMYGPSPEEKVRSWQQKLRQQERQLDREIMNVRSSSAARSFRIGHFCIPDSSSSPSAILCPLTFQLDRATQKSRSELKALAKKNDVKSARILAKELVRAGKQRDRLVSSKARMSSVQMQLQHQLCEYTDLVLCAGYPRQTLFPSFASSPMIEVC